MMWFAAGCRPTPSLTAWKAARLLNGEFRRPSPDTALLLSMNHHPPSSTCISTSALRLAEGLEMVYVKISVPWKPAGGVYLNWPIPAPDVVIVTEPPLADVVS